MKYEGKIHHKDWYQIHIPRCGMTSGRNSVAYIKRNRRKNILKWCLNNCEKRWCEERILVYTFEDEKDSVMFVLKWC